MLCADTNHTDCNDTATFLREMREAGEKSDSGYRPAENQFNQTAKDIKTKSWKDMSKDEQQVACTYQSGAFGISRLPGKKARYQPRYCGHCVKCLRAQAAGREEKFKKAQAKAVVEKPEGQWRKKKLPKEGPERESYKKQVNRKHDKMHMEIPCLEDDSMVEEWVWTDSDDDSLGEVADPVEEIDWDAVNRKCKDSGGSSRVSFGGGIRPDKEPPKEDTKRMVIPEIVVARRDMPKTMDIVNQVNLLEEAETFEEVQNLLLRQFVMAVDALKEAGVDIICINDQYRNLEIEKTIKDWNEFVRNSPIEDHTIYNTETKTDNESSEIASEMDVFYREYIYPGTKL